MSTEYAVTDGQPTPSTIETSKAGLLAGLEAAGVSIEPGTVVKFTYVYDPHDKHAMRYTFAALWVAGLWYVTGVEKRVVSDTYNNTDFMRLLAQPHVKKAWHATSFDRFK